MANVDVITGLGEMYSLPGPSAINRARWKSHYNVAILGGSWYGNVKRDDAIRFANAYTMPESARRLYESLTADLPIFTQASKRRVRNRQEFGDVISDYASYETFRAGLTRDTAFWSDTHRIERRRYGVVSIGVNTSTSAAQDQSELEFRGACSIALCDFLERLGYRVQLWALQSSVHGSVIANNAIELKPASGLLSENGMAFICHLGTWRHFALEWLAKQEFDVSWGFGTAREYSGKQTVDITVPQRLRTEIEAKQWIADTIALLEKRGE